ncbi:MAG: hypothetical protein KJT03_20960, partial [Verrucomicrobiae bacterium]|nr:hypothetical protein [Verrucomicrobiae bacterium]
EVGGARGNFFNPNTEGLENDNLIDPQSNNRIRGLTNADSTRNFFKSDVPWDSYNTYRIDVQRGPNSILFGLGSPAGIINNTTRTAVWDDENRLQLTVDKFESRRLSGSVNRVLWEDELAVRVDFLFDHHKYRQEPTYDNDERVYVTFTYQPEALNNDSTKTSFSANFEDGKIRANRPRNIIPLDFVQDFFIPQNQNGFVGADFANGGKYGPNREIWGPGGQLYNQVDDGNILSNNLRWLGAAANGNSNPVFVFDAVNGSGPTVMQDGIDSYGSFLVINEAGGTGNFGVVQQNAPYNHPFTNAFVRGTTQNVYQAQRLVTIGKQRVASDNGLAFPGFWRDPSFSSTDQFDFYNYLIDGNNKLEQQNFQVFEMQLRNTFLNDRIGYQLSYFRQDMDFRQDANTGTIYAPSVQVEASSNDPLSDDPFNLNPNPYGGRAFIDYELRLTAGQEDIRNREAKQAQVFATLDANDFAEDSLLSYIVGRHNFTGLLKNRQLERYRREFNSIGVDEQTIRWLGGSGPDDPDRNSSFDPRNTDPGAGATRRRLVNAYG